MQLLPIVSVDPGHDGGAVVLEASGRHAVAAVRWRRNPRGYLVRDLAGPSRKVPDLPSVGRVISRAIGPRRFRLIVEGLFVPRPPKTLNAADRKAVDRYTGQVRHLLELAEAAALVYAQLVDERVEQFDRATAAVWRPAILGIPPNSPSKFAEEHAVRAVTKVRPPLVDGLAELATDPHVAEAACLARYGWTLQVSEARRSKAKRSRAGR